MSGLATEFITKQEILDRLVMLRAAGRPVAANYGLACIIASCALGLAADKAGAAYPHHDTAVSTHHTDSETKKIIGKLHDVVEDSSWTLDDLRAAGFSERVIAGVDGMTKRDGEKYFNFVVRAGRNPDSLDVKLKDLHHNLTLSRNNFLISEKDVTRINKYLLAYNYLVDIKRGKIAPGHCFRAWMCAQPRELQSWHLINIEYSPGPGDTPPSLRPA